MDSRLIEDYLRRSGDTELPKGNVEENEHGFCIWRIIEDKLILASVYGDGKYWNEWATKKAEKEGMNTVFCATKRNPAGFIRAHGFKVVGYILERDV